MHKAIWIGCCLIVGFFQNAWTQPVYEYMDLQTHLCMHKAYGIFEQDLQYFPDGEPPALSYKHLLTQVNYANYLENNRGARILVNGAILPEVLVSRKRARARILEQIRFVNQFVAEHSDRFAVARNPAEVRELVHHTDKTIIIHSIEGGKRLIDGPEDAQFWADQGIAFITLIHLIDDEFGGAAVAPDWTTQVINYRAALSHTFHPRKTRGLTDKGKKAIKWLAEAGVMVDLTHMSDSSRSDALDILQSLGLPPLVTHDMFKPLQNQPRGVPAADVSRIYRLGGLMSLPLSGISNLPHHPLPPYQALIDSLSDYCPGSIDTYRLSYEVLEDYIDSQKRLILDQPLAPFAQRYHTGANHLPIGFQSDFNGWLNHHRPRYGEEGCWEIDPDQSYEAIELQGMPHPGLMESHWNWLEKKGVNLDPVKQSSERFLQMWEFMRGYAQKL